MRVVAYCVGVTLLLAGYITWCVAVAKVFPGCGVRGQSRSLVRAQAAPLTEASYTTDFLTWRRVLDECTLSAPPSALPPTNGPGIYRGVSAGDRLTVSLRGTEQVHDCARGIVGVGDAT